MMIFVKNVSINEKWRSALLSRIYVQKCVSLSRLFIKCSVSRLFITATITVYLCTIQAGVLLERASPHLKE